MTICNLFWLGPVANEELEEEVSHDHVCVIWKPVSLQRSELFVVFWERKVGSQTEESDNDLTLRKQRHRREFWLLQQSGKRKQNEVHLKCACRETSEIMKSRLRVQVVQGMSALPSRSEVGWTLGKAVLFDFIRRASVLSSFCFSLFCAIQVFTSEMYVCMVRTVACIWPWGQEWRSCVSSAKDWFETECIWIK